MPRRPLIRSSIVPYHVTVRANNREWFQLPLESIWPVFLSYLARAREQFGIQIHAFVLMANHFHLLVTTPNEDLDIVMRYLLSESSRSINRSSGRINHLFGGPYKWSLITNSLYYLHALKYVYRNPIRAGVCKRVEDYKFSTVRKPHLPEISPAVFDSVIPRVGGELDLGWLNLPYRSEEEDCIRRGLYHCEFKLTPANTKKRLPELFRGAEGLKRCDTPFKT